MTYHTTLKSQNVAELKRSHTQIILVIFRFVDLERNLLITRRVLQVLADFRHPYAIITKSPLVIRDIDLIEPMATAGLATVSISLTTLDRVLARQLEPRAPTPAKRLTALQALSEANIPTCVLAAPMIPALNDCELESIISIAKEAGACYADYTLLLLPLVYPGLLQILI